MTKSTGDDISNDISSRFELLQVLIENSQEADECVLFPENATDEELQTMWVRAEEGSYIHPKDAQ
ncbi:hypothetical protein [Natronococcus sp. A-GB7]|uniref:DUF7511 domain-containing protein n=1 Tax=Natronococcus sp. A-GB7 TaxID=3037649 RepID=UPI00241F6247|nr:hypothetical protein [Natronococcus sp. A-GB7]MDG5821599.1 hypothetical protein [Natronococcus sp. A-GB7]